MPHRTPSASLRSAALFPCLLAGLALVLGCGGGTKGQDSSGSQVNLQSGVTTVSGTVRYPGSATGPIYLLLEDTGGGGNVFGTVLDAPGTYLIQGVPPGTYNLSTSLDILGNGAANANDPACAAPLAVTVAGVPVGGQDLTLQDQAISLKGLAGPSFTVWPADFGATLSYSPLTGTLASSDQSADFALRYSVEWSPTADFRILAGSMAFPAQAASFGFAFLQDPSLAPGSSYYFRMRALGAGSASNPAAQADPVTIGAPAGGITVTGTVAFSGKASGPLFVCCADAAGDLYTAKVAAPVSPQTFAIPGVPEGSYSIWALLDQNGTGLPVAGDPTNILTWNPPVLVSQALGPQSLVLPAGSAFTSVTTLHSQTNGAQDAYQISLSVGDLGKHVTAVTLLSGPQGSMPPQDLGNTGDGFYANLDLGASAPAAGSGFTLRVKYADGTSEALNPKITGVIERLPSGLAPTGAGGGSGSGADTTPVFTWTPPPSQPSPSWYNVYLWSDASGTAWATGWLPSTLTSLTFGSDPTDSTNTADPLSKGITYNWQLILADGNGNMGLNTVTYTP